MYVRKKRVNGRDYHYLVRSRRVDGKVRQEYLEYLGAAEPTLEELEAIKKRHES